MKIVAVSTAVFFALLAPGAAAVAGESWTDRVAFNGDLRLRYEGIYEDGESDRDRMRFRARFGFSAEVNDDVKVVVRLATGGDNPVSANQSFDGGFSTKDIALDRAYVDWKISDNLNFFGGKIKNPQFRAGGAGLIWDSDLNLEGFALKYANGGFFATAGGYSVEERSSADDSLLYTLQAGYIFPLGDNTKLTAGAGYFAYTDTIGESAFFDGNARGNTLDLAGAYVFDYRNTELFAQLDTKAGDWPLTIFVQAVRNNEVSIEDSAYAFGAKVGSAKAKGDVDLSWTYQDIEADAVIGTFNDSNFGAAGTDSDGHLIRARYAYSKNILFAGTLFVNEIDRFQGTEHDYRRIQLDVAFNFN